MNVDAAGVVNDSGKALPALYAVANAPIFAFNDAFFGGEVVGGPMNSVVESSRMTAAVAVRILGGEKAGDIKILPSGFRSAEIRLAAIAALGHQREQAATGKRSSLSPADDLAAIFLANGGDQCRAGDANRGSSLHLIWEDRRRRRSEANALALTGELAHMNRVVTAGQLTASIAHEIRQPLSAIASFGSAGLRWLKHEPPDLDKARSGLENIVSRGASGR